jgi:hypothetical protein
VSERIPSVEDRIRSDQVHLVRYPVLASAVLTGYVTVMYRIAFVFALLSSFSVQKAKS